MSKLSDTVNAHSRSITEIQNDVKSIKDLLQESLGISNDRLRGTKRLTSIERIANAAARVVELNNQLVNSKVQLSGLVNEFKLNQNELKVIYKGLG
jgi:wobble nucleotide-excising tRNase